MIVPTATGAARFAVGAGLAWAAPRLAPQRPRGSPPGRAADGPATATGAVALVMWNMRKRHFSHSWQNSRSEDGGQGRALSARSSERSADP